MADEIKTAAPAEPRAAAAPNPGRRYVGPGSAERPTEPMPLISNLPIDLKIPRLGTLSTKYPAAELPEKYITWVMETNKEAKGWWK